MTSVKGKNGTVVFDGKTVRIERSGMVARAINGSGSKVWPLRQISSIQLTKPGLLINGYFQISAAGDAPKTGRKASSDIARDENSVIVSKKEFEAFEALREEILAAL